MTRALTIRLDDQLAERLRTAAYLRRRHASDIIRTALANYLDDLGDQPIDRIPTDRGRDAVNAYRAHRTRQRAGPVAAIAASRHPLRTDEGYGHHLACPWHPDRAGIFATSLGALCRDCWASNYPQADADA